MIRPEDVPRETRLSLEVLVELVRKWTPRINLVAPATIDNIWARHVEDSLQLWPLRPIAARSWIDLGSGAGFPGLVIAACDPDLLVTLVEADSRKSVFLKTAAREMGLSVDIRTDRIENMAPKPFDVISARALAPLPKLLALAHRFRSPGGVALFPKGRSGDSELTEARAAWHIRAEPIPSRTDPAGTILRVLEFDPLP